MRVYIFSPIGVVCNSELKKNEKNACLSTFLLSGKVGKVHLCLAGQFSPSAQITYATVAPLLLFHVATSSNHDVSYPRKM